MALFSFRKKAGIPTAEEALPGRAEPLAVPDRHFVTRRSIKPPFPEGLEQAVFGMGCFWGAERKFWQTDGRLHDGGRLRGRRHAEPDLRGGVLGDDRPHRGGAGRVRSRRWCPTTPCSASSGRRTIPRRACGRATTRARSTARRSTRTATRSTRRPRSRRATPTSPRSTRAGYGADHDRDPARAAVLLRRGLPPAVPRQESRRLLRNRRHRRGVSRRESPPPTSDRVATRVSRAPRGNPGE